MNRLLRALTDAFLPSGPIKPSELGRMRATIVGSGLGLVFAGSTGATYWYFGSFWSGVSIHLITLGLLLTPFAVRRRVSTLVVGNLMVALTAQAAVVVGCRSGGFASPAVSWLFILPLISYLACGQRSSMVWSGVALAVLTGFFAAEHAGVVFAQDFSPAEISTLNLSGYAGLILSAMALLLMVEGVRVSSEQALVDAEHAVERERILRDLHDGVGSQLLGLIVRARAGRLESSRLVPELEACFDDLRLILGSIDPAEHSLESALAELRARVQLQCETAGVELSWECVSVDAFRLPPSATLHVLRAAQEMLSNALRHSQGRRVTFRAELSLPRKLQLSVRDDGVGFDPGAPPRQGRGLTSLRARALALGGELQVTAASPGTFIALSFPAAAQVGASPTP